MQRKHIKKDKKTKALEKAGAIALGASVGTVLAPWIEYKAIYKGLWQEKKWHSKATAPIGFLFSTILMPFSVTARSFRGARIGYLIAKHEGLNGQHMKAIIKATENGYACVAFDSKYDAAGNSKYFSISQYKKAKREAEEDAVRLEQKLKNHYQSQEVFAAYQIMARFQFTPNEFILSQAFPITMMFLCAKEFSINEFSWNIERISLDVYCYLLKFMLLEELPVLEEFLSKVNKDMHFLGLPSGPSSWYPMTVDPKALAEVYQMVLNVRGHDLKVLRGKLKQFSLFQQANPKTAANDASMQVLKKRG